MLQVKTKEQEEYIKSLVEKESCDGDVTIFDDSINYRVDYCFNVGISFETMAKIVDYLRGQKSVELPSRAEMTFNSGVSEVNLKKTDPVEAKEFILSLGSMGFNTEELMQEYIKHGIIHWYGQK